MDLAIPPGAPNQPIHCRLDADPASGQHPDMDEDDLDARELERIRRRDHDAGGEDRELLKPGMGKVFKQILDRQAREARDEPPDRRRDGRRGGR